MKCALVIAFLLHPFASMLAQKPPIDSSTYENWPYASAGNITNDGKYVTYSVSADQNNPGYTILKSVQGNWKIIGQGFSFTADGRFAYFMGSQNTLCKVLLGGDIVERTPEVTNYQLAKEGSTEWLIYRKKEANGELVMRNMLTGAVKKYSDIVSYWLFEDGKTLLLESGSKANPRTKYELIWENLSDGHSLSIWKGWEEMNGMSLDAAHHQLSFSTQEMIGEKKITSYWYCKAGLDSATLLVRDDDLGGIQQDLQLGEILGFCKEGDRLFINLTEKAKTPPKPLPNAVPVEVWSYREGELQSQQNQELKASLSARDYLAVLFIADHRIIRLQEENDSYMQFVLTGKMKDDIVLTTTKSLAVKDRDGVVRNSNEGELYMVSTKDGSRKSIKRVKLDGGPEYYLSPEGKYALIYDEERNYFSYDTHSGVIRNITQAIPATHIRSFDRPGIYLWTGFKVAGWVAGDSAMLLEDEYDIWEVDLAGNKLPVNLTNGYGRKHNISLQLGGLWSRPVVGSNAELLLYAFNRTNKENGFYRMTIGRKGNPELLTMGPYIYDYPNNGVSIRPAEVIKARDTGVWMVKRMSARESDNYFWTNDFKKFVPVSDVQPEKNWNWVTTELINWKTPDGSMSQGILYKPENFDPGKKYPIIFYYYERLSDGLNACLEPGLSQGGLNILWYVSNGYLVFTPDIYYTIGEMGQSALNYVVSAARYLTKMPWVDSTRMGLQGHSYGAIQTNYIITHSHLFAAACSASGLSDLISAYGSIKGDGGSFEPICETGQIRIGATLWQRPDLYIKNSAIFKVNEVTTPLLLMHTANDDICPLANIEEFYTALWRLKKPVWMLLYGDADHGVFGKSGVDFTIRMQQFFDHYLKGAPMPKWMAEGIPARMKGIETGLELEDAANK